MAGLNRHLDELLWNKGNFIENDWKMLFLQNVARLTSYTQQNGTGFILNLFVYDVLKSNWELQDNWGGARRSMSRSHVLFHEIVSVSVIYGDQFHKFPPPYQIGGMMSSKN